MRQLALLRLLPLIALALAPAVACGSFGSASPAGGDGGTTSGDASSTVRDGSAPGTFCAALPDAGFCEDFDTSPKLQPFWVKSSAAGCDIALDATANSAPRAIRATCTSLAASNHIALPKVSFGRTLKASFAMFIGPHTAPSARLVTFSSEGRTFGLTLLDSGAMSADIDLGDPPTSKSLVFQKPPPSQRWFQVKIEVFYDARDGHVLVDVDENRVVNMAGLFTYKHGQIPPANPMLFGAESATPGGTVDVSFDDIVLDPATVR